MPKFAFLVQNRSKLRPHTNVSCMNSVKHIISTRVNYAIYALNKHKEVYQF